MGFEGGFPTLAMTGPGPLAPGLQLVAPKTFGRFDPTDWAIAQIPVAGSAYGAARNFENGNYASGVVGVAASRIMQKYHKPTIIASHFNGQIIGSGRSIPGFDMIATLREMGDEWFRNYGGHPMACGFTFSA